MIRFWLAVALLAGGGLLGGGYYSPAAPAAATIMLAAAIWLFRRFPLGWPPRGLLLPAMFALVPAAVVLPLPLKTVPVLLGLGVGLRWLAIPRRAAADWSSALVVSGTVIAVQSLAVGGYAAATARAHELPSWLAIGLAGVVRWLGQDAAVDGSWIVLRHADQVYRFAATWDLLFDPGSVAFLTGGLAILGLGPGGLGHSPNRWRAWARRAVQLVAVVAAWAPFRSGLLIGLVLHRGLRADPAAEANVASVLVNGWIHAGLLLGPAALAGCLLGGFPEARGPGRPRTGASPWRPWRAIAWTSCGVLLAVAVYHWSPIGTRSAGRVKVVERHSTWEPTTVPYGTEVYGEAGSYNYAAAYAYCGQYYEMSRLTESEAIDDAALSDCDVLVIKTPTSRYAAGEVEAVVRFVERGGSLLLVGDHTNVFNMNTYLNDIARRFGFSFRNDLLFRVGSPYRQEYVPSWPPHAAVQHVPPVDFAVSCSIDPGFSWGESVIRSRGLYSLPPAYHESNYHPQAEYRTQMQYGAWCQMWSTHHGRGRVAGFADSTLFSNFCLYQPGKAELLRGMLAWLNHRRDWGPPWLLPLIRGALLAAALWLVILGLWSARGQTGGWLVLLCWSLAAGTLGCLALAAWQRAGLPVPERLRPLPCIGIDRTLSEVPLFTGAFADDEQGLGYGLLEQWIPRLGVRIARVDSAGGFEGQGLAVICPTRSVQERTLDSLKRFVREGGHLLVLDSPDVAGSTANSLLQPFGLSIRRDIAAELQGELSWREAPDLPAEELQASCGVEGGRTLATIRGIPVAAQVGWGEGTVTAAGFASLFNDAAMGYHWLPEPEPPLRQRYEVLYHLLRVSLLPD